MTSFLAHQGGWDELAWFAVPIVAVLVWVRWAERRARRNRKEVGTTIPADQADQGSD